MTEVSIVSGGDVLQALADGHRTVTSIAQALDLTFDESWNALHELEADGMVRFYDGMWYATH